MANIQINDKETSASKGEGVPSPKPCILAILGPQLVLARGARWPLRGFALDGHDYWDAGLGEWTGFYDWLRAPRGRVIGVRYWVQQDTEFLAEYTKRLDYVKVDPKRHIEVYFSSDRAIEAKLSCDQEF